MICLITIPQASGKVLEVEDDPDHGEKENYKGDVILVIIRALEIVTKPKKLEARL